VSERLVLVVGFAMTGRAVAAHYVHLGVDVQAVDDVPAGSARAEEMSKAAASLGVSLDLGVSAARLKELAGRAERVVLSPGVPPTHPVFGVAPHERMVSEVQLGSELADEAGIPLVAVTGTNGKTTVTTLVHAMLEASGRRSVPAGNIGRPLVEVASAGGGPDRPEVVVVEVSSFQLAWTTTFRPRVACWLNFAPDHLDWHTDLADYAAAKARIWRNQTDSDAAVWNGEDPVVSAAAESLGGRSIPFGLHLGSGTFHEDGGALLTDAGDVIVSLDELPRRLPHDRTNGLAAAACALSAGASLAGCAAALTAGVPMPHRIELVAELGGIGYFDDSKATTPSAVVAALSGFDSVVLIAGGRNKGLDLGDVPEALLVEEKAGTGPGPGRLRAVVAIGESADDVVSAFSPFAPVERAGSMDEAVRLASGLARAGDAVLLSPGCASFDWYRSYGERGDDFARAVKECLIEAGDRRTP
jgi:UDP-N-acetylmuramoylalanine--D-glutamate ligase